MACNNLKYRLLTFASVLSLSAHFQLTRKANGTTRGQVFILLSFFMEASMFGKPFLKKLHSLSLIIRFFLMMVFIHLLPERTTNVQAHFSIHMNTYAG